MLDKLYKSIRGWDERRLVRKVDGSHHRVLGSFGDFGINIGLVPIIGTTQNELQSIEALERYALDISYNPKSTIGGMYSGLYDAILLDRSTWRWGRPITIDHILTHEYAHRLYRKFMSAVEKKRRGYQTANLNIPALPGTTEETNPLEELKRYIETLKKERRTEDDRRRLEFNIYFEEMFAESVALYLTRQTNGDGRLLDYSRSNQGIVLGQDTQFTRKLEEVLYKIFFERLFSHGLRRVTIELPVSYQFARHSFEKRYQKSLPESTFNNNSPDD